MIVHNNEKQHTTDRGYDMHKFPMHYAEKKPDSKAYVWSNL